MRPAAAGLADAAAHDQHVDQAAVVHVVVVPVVHRRADDDHAATAGLVGGAGELAGDLDHLGARHAGDLFLPSRGTGHIVVVAPGHVAAAEAAVEAVLRHQQVVDAGDQRLAAVGEGDLAHRQVALEHVLLRVVGPVLVLDAAEIGKADFGDAIVAVGQTQPQAGLAALAVALLDVPAPLLAPAEADRAGRHDQFAAELVEGQRLPLGVVVLAQGAVEVAGAQEAAGDMAAIGVLVQLHQQRHVGILPAVVLEILRGLVEMELAQDHVAEGERQRRVGALLRVQPVVGELGDLGIVRGDGDGLGAVVACLGEEVGVRGAGLRDVGAPGDDVAAVVPVGRFGHVGLLAPGLGRGRRQVAVPVVEAQANAPQQRQVARAGGVADHRHGRDRREADHAVRAVLPGGVQVGGGDQLVGLVPAHAHEATHAALGFVAHRLGLVLDDAGPGVHRRLALARLAPQLEQGTAHQRVLHPVRAVQVPRVAGAARAATRLVVGQVRAGARIVGLLGFPGDQPVLDVDLPAARAGAVHAVGRTHDLVVLPTLAVAVFPTAVVALGDAKAIGEGLRRALEEGEAVEEVAHDGRSWVFGTTPLPRKRGGGEGSDRGGIADTPHLIPRPPCRRERGEKRPQQGFSAPLRQ